jgi:mycothiol synthase
MPNCNPVPQIGGILARDRVDALELVFSHLAPEERRSHIEEVLGGTGLQGHSGQSEGSQVPQRFFASLRMTECAGLIGAYQNGRLAGAVLSQTQGDKTAVVWLPRLTADEPESTAIALLDATWTLLAQQRIVLAQVLLPAVDDRDAAILRRGGLRHLANLLFLAGLKHNFPPVPPPTPFDLEPYSADNHDRLAHVLTATFDGTLDCRGLKNMRTLEDVLAGYRSTGPSDPCYWLIARHAGRDVGCLLLADHPRLDNMEIQYLGLVPSVRGRGWGILLARHAQWIAGTAGRSRLVLAVDEANTPAVQTYTATRFQTWQRRRLYVRQLHSVDNWHASSRQVFHAGRPRGGKNLSTTPMST